MTDARANRPSPAPPPTLGMLRAQGVTRFRVSCTEVNCGHGADLMLDTLGLSDDTPFPSIARWRRWKCSHCGSAKGECDAAVAVSLTFEFEGFAPSSLCRIFC